MIFESVKKIIMDVIGLSENEVLLESHLYDDLDADSLDMAQIILSLENEYKMDIEDEEIEGFKTVKDMVKFIEGKVN